MITSTLDPISVNDVTDLQNAPFVIEGEGPCTLKIYFESEEKTGRNIWIECYTPSMACLVLRGSYDAMLENPNAG